MASRRNEGARWPGTALRSTRSSPEASPRLELKRSTAELRRAGETLGAFLNGEGGQVVVGVAPDGKVRSTPRSSSRASRTGAWARRPPSWCRRSTRGSCSIATTAAIDELRPWRPRDHRVRASLTRSVLGFPKTRQRSEAAASGCPNLCPPALVRSPGFFGEPLSRWHRIRVAAVGLSSNRHASIPPKSRSHAARLMSKT
jgi:hypothetical protein